MQPPSLRELQTRFWEALAVTPDAPPPDLLAVVAPRPSLEPADRVRIYGGMYTARLREALREDYPRTAALLGEEAFTDLVTAYTAHHPSVNPSIRYAGAQLATFLAERPEAGRLPFLPDLVRLEWARVDAFDAPDCEPTTLDDLRAVRAEDFAEIRFVPVPSCTVLRVDWPVHRIWSGECDVEPAFTVLRVWRRDYTVFHAPMDTHEQAAFERVRRGEPFAAVAEVFAGLPAGDGARETGALLARWLEDGLLVRRPT